jgi:hypothetical protein
MARTYEGAVQKTTSTAAGPIATVFTTTNRVSVLEMGIFATTAVAGEVGIIRPGTGGAGTVTGVTLQAGDSADNASLTSLAASFATTQPSSPGSALRRIQLPATIGAGVIWTWAPGELVVPASATTAQIVAWQFSSAAVTYDVYVKVLE